MMKRCGPNERIYKEIQKIEELDFAYREEKQPSENVENLCENMVFYPSERCDIINEERIGIKLCICSKVSRWR